MQDADRLATILRWTEAPHVVEVRRRIELFSIVPNQRVGGFGRKSIGFLPEILRVGPVGEKPGGELSLFHVFPWVPSDDPWHRLLQVLDAEEEPAAVVVHAQGFASAPAGALDSARAALATAAEIQRGAGSEDGRDGLLRAEAEILEREILRRLVSLGGRVVAARVFIAGRKPPSPALVATLLDSIDDASTTKEQRGDLLSMLGGARTSVAHAAEILAPLDGSLADVLFSPREANAFLRTAMPSALGFPGPAVSRARTSRFQGAAGTDAPLGANVHRGERKDVSMDEAARFRHTYFVGRFMKAGCCIDAGQKGIVMTPRCEENARSHLPGHRGLETLHPDVDSAKGGPQ